MTPNCSAASPPPSPPCRRSSQPAKSAPRSGPPRAKPPTSAPADLQTLVPPALQQALAAHATGQATPPAPPSTSTAQPAPTPEGWCALHQVQMELRSNARGSWWSHRLADGSYCKGK